MSAETQPTIGTVPVETGTIQSKVRRKALITLLLLAGTLAEILTGSTPFLKAFLPPLGLLLLMGLYGCGALLIRETAIRWHKGWGTILLLGGAYAVGEEGFAAKTMIDPTGSNIGNQLSNHWMGINWVPLFGFTLFHAAFSIVVPLLLVELIFPETKGKRLVGKTGFTISAVVYAGVVILLSLTEPYAFSIPVFLFLTLYAAAFIAAGYYVPASFLQAKNYRPNRRERKFVLLGIGFMSGFFAIFTIGSLLPWPVQAFLYLPLAFLTAQYLVWHGGQEGNRIVKADFILGVLLVFIPLDIINEFAGDVGVLFYTAFVVGLVFWVRRRLVFRPNLSTIGVQAPQI